MQLSTANLQEIETGIWIQRTQTKIKTAMRLNWLAALRQLTNITLPYNNKLETDFHLVASGMVWILVPNTVQRKRIPMVQTAANRLKLVLSCRRKGRWAINTHLQRCWHEIYQNSNSGRNCHKTRWNTKITDEKKAQRTLQIYKKEGTVGQTWRFWKPVCPVNEGIY